MFFYTLFKKDRNISRILNVPSVLMDSLDRSSYKTNASSIGVNFMNASSSYGPSFCRSLSGLDCLNSSELVRWMLIQTGTNPLRVFIFRKSFQGAINCRWPATLGEVSRHNRTHKQESETYLPKPQISYRRCAAVCFASDNSKIYGQTGFCPKCSCLSDSNSSTHQTE